MAPTDDGQGTQRTVAGRTLHSGTTNKNTHGEHTRAETPGPDDGSRLSDITNKRTQLYGGKVSYRTVSIRNQARMPEWSKGLR